MAFNRQAVQQADVTGAINSPFTGLSQTAPTFAPANIPNVQVRAQERAPEAKDYQLNQLLQQQIDGSINVGISEFSLNYFDKQITQDLLKLKTISDPYGMMAKKIADLIQFRNSFINTLEGTSARYQAMYMMNKDEADRKALEYLGPALNEEMKMINSLYPGLGQSDLTPENVARLVSLNFAR